MTEKIKLTTEVLNCDYFNRTRGFNCYKGKNCNEVPDCYYKQLKRKEQECKVLALDARVADNHLQHRIEMCDLLREKLKAKEQECDKLKFNLKGAGILGLMKRNVQLKKALDEIEKICQIKEENSQFVLPSVWQQILEIINKVKESE